MPRLAMVYPSNTKETHGEELLYSPLALAYLARHTPEHYQIEMYDEYVGEDLDPETLEADLVAFSAITPGISRAYALADRLRERGIYCIAGGAHVSALPEEALEHFDTVVIGEGETPWVEFLQDYEANTAKPTYFGPMNVSLENLGTPRRDLIHANYQFPSVLTSRGCPYSCSFCYLTVYKKRKYRLVPHETILEDLDSLRGKHDFVIITDENFMGYSKSDIEDRKVLLRKIIDRNYGFIWGCQTTVNLCDEPELMALMYQSGCRAVFLGFEATDEEALKEVNKKHNFQINYKEAIRKVHDQNIAVIASCILGLDCHKPGYEERLIKDLKEARADFPRVFLMTAWPGTPLFKQLEKEGRACRDWDLVRKDVPSITFKHFSHDEILAARKRILDSFFNLSMGTKTVGRWLLKDRTLISLFIKMSIRNRIAERLKQFRVVRENPRTAHVVRESRA